MQKTTEFAQYFIDRLADRLYTDDELLRLDEIPLPPMELPRAHAATAWVHHARQAAMTPSPTRPCARAAALFGRRARILNDPSDAPVPPRPR